ncbi:skin secretory protein xP2-like [Aquila chrysaetos chrysaetos]|uniref:skin secretory protein xP2-like n=1 Tax=Aquila chrysaetos chrysaetos TaxID=223781 RepID=UPI001B7D4323|nr:skin secretory protein xP2-like [Aquila chrysaetos chrysaetos]
MLGPNAGPSNECALQAGLQTLQALGPEMRRALSCDLEGDDEGPAATEEEQLTYAAPETLYGSAPSPPLLGEPPPAGSPAPTEGEDPAPLPHIAPNRLGGRRRSEAGGQEEPAPPEDGEEPGGEPGDISHEEDLVGSAPRHRWGGDRPLGTVPAPLPPRWAGEGPRGGVAAAALPALRPPQRDPRRAAAQAAPAPASDPRRATAAPRLGAWGAPRTPGPRPPPAATSSTRPSSWWREDRRRGGGGCRREEAGGASPRSHAGSWGTALPPAPSACDPADLGTGWAAAPQTAWWKPCSSRRGWGCSPATPNSWRWPNERSPTLAT